MEQYKKLLADNNEKGRKQSSLDLISNNIKRLYNRCYGEDPEDISQIQAMIEDPNHTFACLQSNWDGKKLSLSTMLSYTNSLLVSNDLFELSLGEVYGDLETELQVRRADEKRKNPFKEPKVTRKRLDEIYEDLVKIFKNARKPSYDGQSFVTDKAEQWRLTKDMILFRIISRFPFRGETGTLKYRNRKDIIEGEKINYLVGEEDGSYAFEFNAYKTDKKYGTRSIPIDDKKLIELLNYRIKDRNSYSKKELEDGFFLFWDAPDDSEESQKKQRNNMSVWVKRFLKRYDVKASLTDVTKLLITEIWDDGTIQDKIQFAEWRGHDPNTASKVYATAR